MVCLMTRANLTEQLLCTITTMILTSKAMASVFADEYYTFNGLRNYLSDNIFKVSDFVREILGDINKRIDIFHGGNKVAKLFVSFELPVNYLC